VITCTVCQIAKAEQDFYFRANGTPRSICKACMKKKTYKYQKKSAEYWAHKRQVREERAEVLAYFRRAIRELTKAALEQDRRDARLASRKEEKKRSRARQPLEKLVRRNNWKARKSGVDGCITIAGVSAILLKQNGVCAYCGEGLIQGVNLNVDHVIPKSRGGGNLDSNIQLLCAGCNATKGTKTSEEFVSLFS